MSHLSHSQLDLFTRCPKQWYADRFEKIEGGPSEALILGSAFHATLEHDGELRRKHKTPLDESNLFDVFLRLHLPKELKEQDPNNALDHMRIKDIELRGEAMLRAYARSVAPRYYPVLVEDPFEVHIPHDKTTPLLDIEGEPWTVTGFIDAITINSRGEFVIIDWKTASKPWKPGAEHDKDQATMYMLAQLLRGKDVPKQVTFITFPTMWNSDTQRYECGSFPRDEEGEITGDFQWKADVRVTTRNLEQVSSLVYSLRHAALEINKIRAGEAEAVAKPHGLCPYCPINNRCLPGLQWMKHRNKKLPSHEFTREQLLGEDTGEQSA